MPFILSNGDVCDDEDIYGSQIHDYDTEYDSGDERDNENYRDPVDSELIDRFEFVLAMANLH